MRMKATSGQGAGPIGGGAGVAACFAGLGRDVRFGYRLLLLIESVRRKTAGIDDDIGEVRNHPMRLSMIFDQCGKQILQKHCPDLTDGNLL